MPNIISHERTNTGRIVTRFDDNTLVVYHDNGDFKWMKGIKPYFESSKTRWVLHREGFKPACLSTKDGVKTASWFYEGKLHRENDLPAQVTSSILKFNWGYIKKITKRWYIYGNLHRENDKPAFVERVRTYNSKPNNIYKNGGSKPGKTSEEIFETGWYYYGKPHRDNDLPAFIKTNDGEITETRWYNNGKLHRENGLPSVIDADRIEFHVNGELHNLKHSARIDNNGKSLKNGQFYFKDNGVSPVFSIHGKRIREETFIEFQKWLTESGIDVSNISPEDNILIDMKWNFNGR